MEVEKSQAGTIPQVKKNVPHKVLTFTLNLCMDQGKAQQPCIKGDGGIKVTTGKRHMMKAGITHNDLS